jgi:hypothetical protein
MTTARAENRRRQMNSAVARVSGSEKNSGSYTMLVERNYGGIR